MTKKPQQSHSQVNRMVRYLKIARLVFAGAAVTVLSMDFFFPGASAELVAFSGVSAGAIVLALKASHIIV
ncbi:hypothetical protein ACQZ45_05420 [Agrobacterium sp. 16-2014-1-2a]